MRFRFRWWLSVATEGRINLPRFFLFIAGKNLVLLQHSFPALSWNCTRARPVFANLLVVCKTEKRLRVCDRSGPLKVISIASASQLSKTLSVTFLAMFSKHSEAIIVSHEAFYAPFRPHAPNIFSRLSRLTPLICGNKKVPQVSPH